MANWFVRRDGNEQGPFTFQKLKIRAATGTLRPNDLLRQDGTKQWEPAVSVEGLFGPEHPTTPVRPPPPQRAANTAPGLNSGSTTPHRPTTKPAHVAESPIFATEASTDSPASSAASPSHSSPAPEGISEALASGANDVMSSIGELANAAKGVGQNAAAKTRKTQQ